LLNFIKLLCCNLYNLNYFIDILIEIYILSNLINIKCYRDFTQEFEQKNNYNEIDYNTNNINNALIYNNYFNELGHYLAGLIESDGSIIIPPLGSKNTPNITISFHEDDKGLADKICSTLGYGSLELIPLNKAVKIHSRGKYCIINLLRLINGKFRTPKIEKLNSLIFYINENWSKNIVEPLLISSVDESSLSANSWFSGFSVGDANFYININWASVKNYGEIKLTFEIVQSKLYKEHFV